METQTSSCAEPSGVSSCAEPQNPPAHDEGRFSPVIPMSAAKRDLFMIVPTLQRGNVTLAGVPACIWKHERHSARSRQAESQNPSLAKCDADCITAFSALPGVCLSFARPKERHQRKRRPRERRLRRSFACSPCGGRRVNSRCAFGQHAPLFRRLGCAAQPLPMGNCRHG